MQGSQILEKWEMQSSIHLSRRLLLVPRSRYLIDFSAFLTSGRGKKLCCSVTKLYPTLRPHGLQHTKLPCPSPSPRVCSNSCPGNQVTRYVRKMMQEIGFIKISPENLII